MKKIYTAPSVEVVLIRPSHMIMGSLNPEKGTGSVTEEFVPEGTTGEAHSYTGGWIDDDMYYDEQCLNKTHY